MVITGANETPVKLIKNVVSKRKDIETNHEEADNIISFSRYWQSYCRQRYLCLFATDKLTVFVNFLNTFTRKGLVTKLCRGISSSKLICLPPTFEAVAENGQMAHYQAIAWRSLEEINPRDIDLTTFG